MAKVNKVVSETPEPASIEQAAEPAKVDVPVQQPDSYAETIPANIEASPEFTKYEIAKRISRVLASSSMVPENYRGKPADCFVAIQMGSELGMGPFQSIQSIAVIDGRPSLWGDGLIGIVRASPLCLWIREWYDEATATAWCETKRRGDVDTIKASFSKADADMAGLTVKTVWRKYMRRMLQLRARAFCLRDAYPDVLKGLGVAEELMDYSNEPAPVRSYDMPRPTPVSFDLGNGSAAPLQRVIEAISTASNLAELLKAGDLAKSLTDDEHIKAARIAYTTKREALTSVEEK